VTTALPFGLAEIDARLPVGGLALGALHEGASGGHGAIDGAAAAFFVAGIAARTRGKVLRCLDRPDLFAPALAQADLKSDRSSISKAATRRRSSITLRKVCVISGWGPVVAEVARLPMPASRRPLQLAAKGSRNLGVALRRWRRRTEATDLGQPTAATRWRISALPSTPLPLPGVGRPRWLVELVRCPAGESADFELEACDDKGHARLPSDPRNRQVQVDGGRGRASA